jgi:choline dehydrogenase
VRDGFAPDVIVVGAGSAGCALTRRLVDAGVDVLLLEAGGPDDSPAIHDPARFHELWLAPEDWAYYTTPQSQAADRSLHWPRGKVLGGSSCLNGLIHVRGARTDYEEWVRLGAEGWGWDDVLPAFVRMEDFDAGPSELHGSGGPLRVMSRYELAPVHEAIMAAAVQIGVAHNPDHNAGVLDGVAQMQLTIRDGKRDSAAAAYLRPVIEAANLRVLTGAHAHRLLLDGTRCTGVEFARNGDGDLQRAYAGAEVVVSAGAIESPALLLRSGIGPADDLRALGIEVTAHLPGVGHNLHDHLLSPSIWSAEREIVPFTEGLSPIQTHMWWRSRSDLPGPDTQPIHFSVPLYEPWMEGPPNAFTLMGGMVRPQSRGTIRLSGPGADAPLVIDPQILSAESDVVALEASLAQVREMGSAPALRAWGARELYPGSEVSTPAQVRDYVRRTAISYHHQVGTCKMGTDAEAVVDPRLRVHGVEGLRVADASVMPAVTSGNTNAPSLMIGERAADFIAADAAAQSAERTSEAARSPERTAPSM